MRPHSQSNSSKKAKKDFQEKYKDEHPDGKDKDCSVLELEDGEAWFFYKPNTRTRL